MTLLSPLHLLGALGIAVPVLIHLFGRRRPRLVRFPSLMLLQAARQRRRSPLRLRRLLSLLMRAGAIALLSLALAGPVMRWAPLAWLAPGGQLHAVVLDCSASMGAGGAFDRAREAAREVIRSLPPGSRVLMLAARADVSHLSIASPLSSEEALKAIEGAALLPERARPPDVIGAVLARMAELGKPGTVFLVTDLQASGYEDSASGAGAEVVVVDAGAEANGNLAVTSAAVVEPIALSGRPLAARVRVDAWGEAGGERLPVTARLGADIATAGITPVAGHAAWADLALIPSQAGVQAAAVALPQDDFPVDDGRLMAVHVRRALRVLVVGEEERCRFLRAALDPFGDERSVVQVRVTAAAGLSEADLRGQDVAILADLPLLPASALEALAAEAGAGLGVLVFAGPDAVAQHYADRVLPALALNAAKLGEVRQWDEDLAVSPDDRHPGPLGVFADPLAGDLSAPRFTRLRELKIAPGGDVVVWARFSDGTPAAVGGASGRGRVALLNTAPDDAWSDLVRQAVFVPLIHRLVYYLAAGRELPAMDAPVGEATVGLAPKGVGELTIGRVSAENDEPLPVESGVWRHVPAEVGVYRLRAGEEELGGFAVNLDPAESDLTRLTAAEVRARLRPLSATVVAAADAGRAARAYAAPAAEVSGLLALLALLLLAAEAVYSLEDPQPVEE